MHLCCWFARKILQFTHVCGVKFLAWKSGSVNFLTYSMSGCQRCPKVVISDALLYSWVSRYHDSANESSDCLWYSCCGIERESPILLSRTGVIWKSGWRFATRPGWLLELLTKLIRVILKSLRLNFEQNELKSMKRSGAARAWLRFFLHLPDITITIIKTLQKFHTKKNTS